MREDLIPSRSDLPVRKLLMGAAAGFVATAPMSIFMAVGWLLLPRPEKYPLPPRLITEEITERAGLENHLQEDQLVGISIFFHFCYGALFGSVYALLDNKILVHASLQGALAGLALWVGSYLGWLPAAGILRPATRHPWRRNLLMIVAHLVWGVTLGEVMRKVTDQD